MECNTTIFAGTSSSKSRRGGQRNVLNFQKYKFDVFTSNYPTEKFENYVRFYINSILRHTQSMTALHFF